MSKKTVYTARQASNVFAKVNDAFKQIRNGSHVKFVVNNPEGASIVHGVVVSKWDGTDRRLVVRDDQLKMHYLRDLTSLLILSHSAGGYIPVPAYRDVMYY